MFLNPLTTTSQLPGPAVRPFLMDLPYRNYSPVMRSFTIPTVIHTSTKSLPTLLVFSSQIPISAWKYPFDPDHMAETYQAMADLIAPYAIADVGEAEFDAVVQQLIEHAYQRADAVEEFLTTP